MSNSPKVIMFLGKPALDITFVHDSINMDDQKLFLGPFSDPSETNTFIILTGTPSWEEVAVLSGAFKSKSDARRNGWTGEIPKGFNQRAIGQNKNRRCLTVLNELIP